MLTVESLQLRPTIMPNSSDCNLRCGYCYCHRDKVEKKHFMKDSTLENTIMKFLKAYPNYISFCWHGGEPLLSGLEFFKKICEFQNKYRLKSQRIENRLQTNATLINQNWVIFFKEFDFKVGISIDGPAWLNDQQRIFTKKQGSFEKIIRGIDLLRNNQIPFSVIITVTNETAKYPEELYRFVVSENFSTVKFNPCFGDHPFHVNFIEYAHFMNKIFDLWFSDDRVELSLGHIEDIVKGLLGGGPNICHIRNTCYRHVKIDYNGDVLPCDTFLGDDFKFGNITNQEISDIINGKNYREFFVATGNIPDKCSKCKWYNVCGSGCSRYSFDLNLEKRLNKMCEAKQIMFEHISRSLNKERV